MKVFFAILLAVVAVFITEGHGYIVKTSADYATYIEKCSSKLNIPADYVEKYKKYEFPDDSKTHCYMKCLFEEFELFDERNGFNIGNIRHQIVGTDKPDDKNNETYGKIDLCVDKNTQGSDNCTWAYRIGTCIVKGLLPLVKESFKETH